MRPTGLPGCSAMIPRWSRTLRRYSIDLDSGTLTIQLADGALLSDRLPADLAFPGVDARRVAVDLVDRELVLALRSGTELTLELGSVGAPADRRPVVYLDQLHWVALAQQLWAPERVAEHN